MTSSINANRLLIRGARIFDGAAALPRPADVLVEGEFIAAVDDNIPRGNGIEIVDAAGKFLMPGMIDSHVHATLFGEDGLMTYARMGVTTVKDLGGEFERTIALRDRSRAGDVPGARVLAVGAFVEGDPPAWGTAGAAFSGMEPHRQDDEIDRTIERNIAAGVDGIKLYAGLPPQLLQHAVDTVARRVPVTGHLTATTASEAVDAGIDGLEHLQLTLYRDLVPQEHALSPGEVMSTPSYWEKVRRGWEAIDARGDRARALAATMADRGTRMIATLVLGERNRMQFSQEEEAAFTSAQRERIAAMPARPRPNPDSVNPSADNMIAMVDEMHRAGVRLLPGTDCGAVPVPPGYGYHRELALMAQAMPNVAVLAAATSGAAAWLRRGDLGAIAPKKRADLVLIDGDPLQDIHDTIRIEAVFMNGARLP